VSVFLSAQNVRRTLQGAFVKIIARLILLLLLVPALCWAQAYPAKPIRMIIAFPPGGPTDIVARIVAQKLGEQLGQQVLVDNRPGAGGNIAAELAARATPDGYTIFYNTSAIVIGPALYAKVNYDTVKDFVPVALTATVPLVLLVHPSVPVKTPRDLVELGKAKPGTLNYSSSGIGTITHLAAALLAERTGITVQHVPYKGSAPALVDLVGGQVQFMIDTINTGLPYVRDGRLRAVAVATIKRSSVLPDLPTLDETLLPGFEMSAWQGVVVPAGTPMAVVERLNAELNKVMASPDVRSRLALQGAEPLGGTSAEYAAYMQSESVKWSQVIKAAGVKAE
jgi:tripartite-type tricarboxylate transporter receptor subunit TctC